MVCRLMVVVHIIYKQILIYRKLFSLHLPIGYAFYYCLGRYDKAEVLKVWSGLGTLQLSKAISGVLQGQN